MEYTPPKIYEAKMDSRLFSFCIQLILIVSIPLLGYLCRQLTVPNLPLAFSVLWAPAGVSLAFILLFGFSVWKGIFLGNLIYNLLNISFSFDLIGEAILTSVPISFGSMLQALMAGFIIRRFSTPSYFFSAQDMAIFLFPAGLLSCLIASSIATIAVYIANPGTWDESIHTWVTFWLGDSMGVYVFTPLIVIIATQKFPFHFLDDFKELTMMAGSFIIVSWLSFYKGLPLPHLMIPLCLWITYRFRLYGAALSTLTVALVTVIPSTLGYGVFVKQISEDPILYLVSFLEVIIGANLFFAGIINERAEAWNKLDTYTHGLENHLKLKSLELRQVQEEIYLKEKLASIGMMMAGIGRELKKPMDKIGVYISAVKDCVGIMDKLCHAERKKMPPETANSMMNMLQTLKQDFSQIQHYYGNTQKMVNMVIAESTITEAGATPVKPLNVHTLLNSCISHSIEELHEKHPALKVTVTKEYDKEVEMVEGVAEDLTHAFINLVENSLSALVEKSEEGPSGFILRLFVKTENAPEHVTIRLRDNAGAVSERRIANFFEPFVAEEGRYDRGGIRLAMTHDIIVNEHHGDITVEAEPGEFQQINIRLPKHIHTHIPSL